MAVWAQTGDEECKAALAQMMRPYVIKYLRRFPQSHFTRDQLNEMTQHAWLGVWTALGRFDVTKNVKFSGYAWYWMRHEVMEYIAHNVGSLPMPRSAWHNALLLENAFRLKYGDTAPIYEAADDIINALEVSVIRDGEPVLIRVPHAADIIRARKSAFAMADWDSAGFSSAEDDFFETVVSADPRPWRAVSALDKVHLFLDSLDELDPVEWLSAAESFVESQNWPDETAQEILRFKEDCE